FWNLETGVAYRADHAEGDDVAGHEHGGRSCPRQELRHRPMAARRIERAFDHEVVVEPQARIAERVTVAREALLRCRVGKGSVRDAGDRHMAEADEVLNRLASPGPVVDVDARRIQV